MRRSLAFLAMLLAMSGLMVIPAADRSDAHIANGVFAVNAPFSGTVNRFNYTSVHPLYHHTVYGGRIGQGVGDWAVDFYVNAPVTEVRAHIGNTTIPYAPPHLKVLAVKPACASGVISYGGYWVSVGVYNTYSGAYIGRVDYAHINSPQVYEGQYINQGQLLGWTARFTRNSCYDVSTDSGVHVHMEAYNSHHWACYSVSGWAQNLNAGGRLGYVGSDDPGQYVLSPQNRWKGNGCDRSY